MSHHGNRVGSNVLNRTLGGLALGLGATQLAAPRQLARLVGLRPSPWTLRALRLLGMRESASGLALLLGHRSRGWLAARVAGDALDARLLLRAVRARPSLPFRPFGRSDAGRLGTGLALVGGVAALDLLALALAGRRRRETAADRAPRPGLTASITIDRSPADLYAFWRDVENFPRFVPFLEQVKAVDDRTRSHWRAKLPHAPAVEWDAVIVDDRPGHRIAWKIETGVASHVLDSGEVRFEPAPGGQGTEVHLTMWGNALHSPRLLDKGLRRLPERFWATQLRRFKQLMELGEIVQSDASLSLAPHPAQPSLLPGEREPVSPGMRESEIPSEQRSPS